MKKSEGIRWLEDGRSREKVHGLGGEQGLETGTDRKAESRGCECGWRKGLGGKL